MKLPGTKEEINHNSYVGLAKAKPLVVFNDASQFGLGCVFDARGSGSGICIVSIEEP